DAIPSSSSALLKSVFPNSDGRGVSSNAAVECSVGGLASYAVAGGGSAGNGASAATVLVAVGTSSSLESNEYAITTAKAVPSVAATNNTLRARGLRFNSAISALTGSSVADERETFCV